MSQCARERKSLPVFSESPVLHPADCLSRDWGCCPPQSPSRGPWGDSAGLCQAPCDPAWLVPSSLSCQDSESSSVPSSKVPSLSTAVVSGQDVSSRRGSEAARGHRTGGGAPILELCPASRAGSLLHPHWNHTDHLRAPHSSFHSLPGKAQSGGAVLFGALRRAQGAARRTGPRPSGLRGRGSTHVPPGRGRGRRQGSVSTIAFLLTMGSNFTFPSITCTVFS